MQHKQIKHTHTVAVDKWAVLVAKVFGPGSKPSKANDSCSLGSEHKAVDPINVPLPLGY